MSGCAEPTTYEQMVSETKTVTDADAIAMVIGSTINGTDSDLDGTAYELNYVFNSKSDLIRADVDNVQMYFTSSAIYIKLGEKWLQQDVDLESYGQIQEAISYEQALRNLPDGNQTLGADLTGIASIDKAISGKTLNDLVISTGERSYTLTGLEDKLTITTGDSVRIDYNGEETGAVYLSFSPSDKISLPAAAKNAINVDDLARSV